MKVISPFRPFQPESPFHLALGPFDWIAALKMLRHSVKVSNGCDTYVISDRELPGLKVHKYKTKSRRLMLWLLEIIWQYLESPDFDQDTVFIAPDDLVFSPLEQRFGDYDLGLLYRPPVARWDRVPLLLAVQFFRRQAQKALAKLYKDALKVAR